MRQSAERMPVLRCACRRGSAHDRSAAHDGRHRGSAQVNIGGGGAVIGGQGANRGTPILPVTPQLLDVTDTTNTTPASDPNVGAGGEPGSGYASDELRGAGDIGGLSRSRVADDASTAGVNEATNASNQLDAFDATPTLLASGHNAIGTQDLSTAAAGRVKRIGFAFTEPVTLTGTGSPTVVGVATPGFTITNLASETRIDEDGKTVFLVTADVSDIFAFEAAARSHRRGVRRLHRSGTRRSGTVATAENNANARVALVTTCRRSCCGRLRWHQTSCSTSTKLWPSTRRLPQAPSRWGIP
jgi:hypothetical protein